MSIQSRALSEIMIELLSVLFYVWYLERNSAPWVRSAFFWILCVGFPFFCIWKEQEDFPEFSLDWDEFIGCLRNVLWFTLTGTTVLIGLGLLSDGLNYDGQFLLRFSEYIFWSFLQQIGLQIFLTRRAQRVTTNPWAVSGIAATVFSLIHFPNPALMLLTWLGGFFWSLTFQKTPNLYALSVSHGWLAVTSLYSIPPQWMHGLRIGPGYWTF
ncbi:MAG: CPBP family intramembrane metalloprotease [Elusimicrobia bacterium]|nr:CPBP family intramembrane metalloprotease [Elusimicrobiota bacterium]